jgi:hypothetical protein
MEKIWVDANSATGEQNLRPLYETGEDLQNELNLATKIEKIWKCKFRKMPMQYKIDFALERNKKIVAFCEIKERSYSMDEIDSMGGYKISLAKWMAGIQLMQQTGLPFILLIGANNGAYQKTIKYPPALPLDLSVWGRGDRSDPQDFEPCVSIPVSEFKQVQIRGNHD